MRRSISLSVLVMLFIACSGKDHNFTPPDVPQGGYSRIISLTPSITEILFAMGAKERIAGVTSWCDYPEEAKSLPKVGDFKQPNMEALLALKPDLIVLAPTGSLLKKSYDNLSGFGIPMLVVWNNTCGETIESIMLIGRTIQMEDAAKSLAQKIQDEIALEKTKFESCE